MENLNINDKLILGHFVFLFLFGLFWFLFKREKFNNKESEDNDLTK